MKRIIFLVVVLFSVLSIQITNAQSDAPCGAPLITVGQNCIVTNGTTVGASYSNDAANGGTPSCAAPGAPDVWYSFVAPAGGSVNISATAGSFADGGMALYSGACGSLTQVSCDDDSGPGTMPALTSTGLTPGATYYLRFWRYSSGTGTFSLCLTIPGTNTVCSAQQPICSGSPLAFTANSGSPNASVANPGNNYGCLISSPNPSWYYLEIATGGTLVVDLSASQDVDFAIWGPFASIAAGSAACGSYAAPLDCSFSTSAVEQVNVAGVTTGQVYVLLVTNFASVVQTINVTNGGGTATTNCAIVPLPVGYSSWNASLSSDKVRLNWTTESELNSDYFAVQRSNDGIVWETIGFTDASGTTNNSTSYAFTDEKPKVGINYYRLRQVDFDGNATFTTTIAIEYQITSPLDIYPNPAKGLVFVKQKQFAIQSIELIDLAGRVWELPTIKGNNGVSADVSSHAQGTYTVRSTDEVGNTYSTLLVIE